MLKLYEAIIEVWFHNPPAVICFVPNFDDDISLLGFFHHRLDFFAGYAYPSHLCIVLYVCPGHYALERRPRCGFILVLEYRLQALHVVLFQSLCNLQEIHACRQALFFTQFRTTVQQPVIKRHPVRKVVFLHVFSNIFRSVSRPINVPSSRFCGSYPEDSFLGEFFSRSSICCFLIWLRRFISLLLVSSVLMLRQLEVKTICGVGWIIVIKLLKFSKACSAFKNSCCTSSLHSFILPTLYALRARMQSLVGK